MHLHSDSLLCRQLSPWFQKVKAGCLHEDHTPYIYKLSTFCVLPTLLRGSHMQSPTWLVPCPAAAGQTSNVSRMSSTGFTHRRAQPATCLGISRPSHNCQGNVPLPQRCSKSNLAYVLLSRARKANNHTGSADKGSFCYVKTAPFCRSVAERELPSVGSFQDHVGVRLVLCVCYEGNPSMFQKPPAFLCCRGTRGLFSSCSLIQF